MYRIILPLLLIPIFLFSVCDVHASGGILWNHQISLDKTVYLNEESVQIRISGEGDRIVHVEVFDITNPAHRIVFSESKQLKDESAMFEFAPDYNSDAYRYQVNVYDIDPDRKEENLKDTAYFFTKENADEIIIVDLTTEKDSLLPGNGTSLGLKIQDGLGNTVDFMEPSVRLYYQTSSGEKSRGVHEIKYDAHSQKYFGWIEIPNSFGFSGTAELRATVFGPENLKYIISDTKSKQIEIIDTGVREVCYEGQQADCIDPEKIIVENVQMKQTEIYPGDTVVYTAEIIDENGNPLNLVLSGRVDYEAPWGPSNYSSVGTFDKANKKFVGKMTVPDIIAPGDYVMKLSIQGMSGGPLEFSGIKEIDFTIKEKQGQLDTIFSPESLDDLRGEYRFYQVDEPRIIQGNLVAGHYYSPPLSNHTVSILVYGDSNNGEATLLEAIQTTSDNDGFFSEEIFLNDRNYCEYDVMLKSEYAGFEQTEEIVFRMSNTKTFYVSWDGEKIPVTVEGQCSVPLDMAFDQAAKKMTIDVDTADTKKFFEIFFPYKLLDGDLTIQVNNKTDDSLYTAQKIHDGTRIQVRAVSDHTTVEIVGTTAIPEFYVTVLILAASIIPIMFLRKQLVIK